jgi:cardiolipin synthase
MITVLRLLLLAPFVLFLLDGKYAAALLVFAVAGISDGIDGYLARHHGWSTPLGAVLDPLADKLLMAISYLMLGWLDLIPVWIVTLVIGRDLIIVGGALAYARLVKRPEMAPSRISKFNTAAQIIFVLSVLTSLSGLDLPQWWLMSWLAIMVTTTLWSGTDYVWRWSNRAISEHKEQG